MSARLRNPDRVAAKRFADAHGYFWLPCPRCGEHFGGHEWPAEHDSVQCVGDPDTGHGACCPRVSDEQDAQACRRVHEMHGEPVPTRTEHRCAIMRQSCNNMSTAIEPRHRG